MTADSSEDKTIIVGGGEIFCAHYFPALEPFLVSSFHGDQSILNALLLRGLFVFLIVFGNCSSSFFTPSRPLNIQKEMNYKMLR